MCDDASVKERIAILRANLDNLIEIGASTQEIYNASRKLDDCLDEFMNVLPPVPKE